MINEAIGLFLIIGLPLLLAISLLFKPSYNMALKFAPWAALPAFLISLSIKTSFDINIPWLLLGTEFGIDETAQIFLFFSSILWLSAGIYSISYFHDVESRRRFFFWFLLTMTGSLGLILTEDLPGFYLFFATMSFAAYGLVIHEGSQQAIRAGRIYIILVIAGEVLMFAAMVIAANLSHELSFDAVKSAIAGSDQQNIIIGLVLLSFGIKAGLIGLHVWLPLAHPVAPTPASAVLSGAIIKAGLLGWLRLLPLGETALPQWGEIFIMLGLLTSVYAAFIGFTQRNAKTVLAYSSISQMGIMTVAIGLGLSAPDAWPLILNAILIYVVHHSLSKGALFLGVGVASKYVTSSRQRLLTITGLLIPALAMAGAPLTSGMLAKVSLKAELYNAPAMWNEWLPILMPWTSLATTLLIMRFLFLVWPSVDNKVVTRMPVSLWSSWLLLIIAVLSSVWLIPVDRLTGLFSVKNWVASSWPVLFGIAIAGLIMWLGKKGFSINLLNIPAGDILVIVEKLLQKIPLPKATHHHAEKESAVLLQPQEMPSVITKMELLLRQWTIAIGLLLSIIIAVFLLLKL